MTARFDRPQSWSLVKVPHKLRQVNENAYEPQLISIGPYHYGKSHLAEMEVYKKRCLKMICDKKGTERVASCLQEKDIEAAWKCYSPSLDPDEWEMTAFVEMMLLDGCLVVALLCWKAHEIGDLSFNLSSVQNALFPTQEIGPVFNLACVQNALFHDMLLLENQLPFFVLMKLYRMIYDNPSNGQDFAARAFRVLRDLLPGPKKWIDKLRTIKDKGNIEHLLSLVHDNWYQQHDRTTIEKETAGEKAREEGGERKLSFKLSIERAEEMKSQGDEESGVTNREHREKKKVRKGRVEWKSIRCATELDESRVKFENVGVGSNANSTEDNNVESLFDISFSKGIMKIPTFVIDFTTERLFRNLIAYEQYAEGSTFVIDYVTLMDNLVNSAKDVKLLRFRGIIENMLGDDEAVAQMINKLRDHVTLCSETFYYEEIFVKVKRHCARRWNTWRAILMHDYFHSPWALLSFLAASLVILLTITRFVLYVLYL